MYELVRPKVLSLNQISVAVVVWSSMQYTYQQLTRVLFDKWVV